MSRKRWWALGLAAFLGGTSAAQAQYYGTAPTNVGQPTVLSARQASPIPTSGVYVLTPEKAPSGSGIIQVQTEAAPGPVVPETRQEEQQQEQAPAPPEETPLGPTPLDKVGILQGLIFGDNAKDAPIKISGWYDPDYTYRSTGHGENNIAPVMNRFGDEFLNRQIGLYLSKPLDEKTWSWGFNAIFIGGADASFLTPTAGGWRNTNPRFGSDFTDLNVTAHLPILTDGGVDVKAGRQTTVLGPMGALPWQRYFDSSDYAWYNMEEGRYTGISANWMISKRLSWYNGIEFGWGTFYDVIGPAPQYITQINYWLDEEAKNTKVWTTVLTGPTGMEGTGNTTVLELGLQHNYNKYWYQIIDSQMVWSKCPIFGPKPPGYTENAYDVYTYIGVHLNKCVDLNCRLEWYDDINGGGYPGGFGIPHTNYYAVTVGPDYHPVKWLQLRPEIRYDYATHEAFGQYQDKRNQLSIACDALFKF